jgi:hypothetical protein
MTLVAAFEISNTPVLLGDLLLSSPNTGDSISIPTIGDTSRLFPPNSSPTIRGLVQKINLIDKNLVVGWAGNFYIAKKIISLLEKQARIEPFTKESLDSFFEFHSGLIKGEVISIIGYLRTDNGVTLIEKHSDRRSLIYTSNIPNFGTVKICGDGYYNMEDLLNKFSRLLSTSQIKYEDKFQKIVNQLGAMCGWFYSDEMRLTVASKESTDKEILDNDDYCRTLLSLYGGGYEIATLIKHGFAKLGNFTYLTWITEKVFGNTTTYIGLLPKAFHITYTDDNILLIYVIDFDRDSISITDLKTLETDTNTYRAWKISKLIPYIIPPIYKDLSDDERSKAIALTEISWTKPEAFFNFIYPLENKNLVGNPISIPTHTSLESKTYFQYLKKSNEIFLGVETSYLEYLSTFHNVSTEI